VAQINAMVPYSISTTYSLLGSDGVTYTGSAEVNVIGTPEPISMIFFGTGLVAIGGYVSRKRMLRKA
jgi:hypothetical protein